MRRLLLILLAPLLLLGQVAWANEPAAKATGAAGQYVDLQPIALPIVVNGVLINYVFVNVRINLTGGADVTRLRDKEPFFRDALVRAGHRTPFVLASDYQKIDEARMIAALTRDATAIAGPGMIRSIVITSQATQRPVATPRAAAQSRP